MKDLRETLLRDDPKFRKAWYELQWDTKLETSHQMMLLRIGAGLTQDGFAAKTGILQPALSRAEHNGCSLELLQKAAKALGKVVKLHIENEAPLNPIFTTHSDSDTFTFEGLHTTPLK